MLQNQMMQAHPPEPEPEPEPNPPKEDAELDLAVQESLVLANEEEAKRAKLQEEEDKMMEV